MLKNRDRVAITLKEEYFGSLTLNGTIYHHSPEWVELDWDGVNNNNLEIAFESILIPRENIAIIRLVEQA